MKNRFLSLCLLAATVLPYGGRGELRAETPAGSPVAPKRAAHASAAPHAGTARPAVTASSAVSAEPERFAGAACTAAVATPSGSADTASLAGAARPAAGSQEPFAVVATRRMRHLAPRGRAQHTFFANAGYTAILTTLYLKRSSSGTLNEGLDITAGYNWTSRRGLGAGVVYSGGFLSAERDGYERTSRTHYFGAEFVARQRAGRRWLFRESAGVGYARYVRGYAGQQGSRGGAGIHESASVEFMLTRHLGLGAGFSGQWLLVPAPDVDDGKELSFGILRIQFGGGVRVYF